MNRLSRDPSSAGRAAAVGPSSSLLLLQQRRARAAASASSRRGFLDTSLEEDLDLFSKTRRSVPVVVPATPDPPATRRDDPDGFNDPPKLPSISVASIKLPKTGIDDLLSAADSGKHDYDWLLTPPGTPLSGAVDSIEHHTPSVLPKNNAPVRSLSTSKASRLSTSHIESSQPARPTRSNSATRPSISTSHSAHFSNGFAKNSVLNTSTASVTSIRSATPTRPSTPTRTSATTTRPSTPKRVTPSSTTTKPTAPVTRSGITRPSTPVKVHPTPTACGDKTRPLHTSRPSTPTSRPQISSTASSPSSSSCSAAARPRPSLGVNSNSTPTLSRANSRPSTPTRRATTPSTPVISRSSSVGRGPPGARTPGPASRPSSPGPKSRTLVQPIVPADFPLDAPPNLRTKLPERPTSVGRTRPGTALATRSNVNSEAPVPTNSIRRPSSPVVSRGRLPENNPKARVHNNNGVDTTPPDVQKALVPDGAFKKPARTATATESTGFGRTISKKSLDMALRHMDIRQGIGGIRGASLFPQSIKSAASKAHSRVAAEPVVANVRKGTDTDDGYCNGNLSTNGSINDGLSENSDSFASSPRRELLMATSRTVEPDIYESSRYDAILLKEDSKNMSWLHSVDDKSDQSPVFDHRFEPLPEPFSLI